MSLSFCLFAISFCWSVIETQYFGNNRTPQSIAEATCEGISYGLCLASIFCWGRP